MVRSNVGRAAGRAVAVRRQRRRCPRPGRRSAGPSGWGDQSWFLHRGLPSRGNPGGNKSFTAARPADPGVLTTPLRSDPPPGRAAGGGFVPTVPSGPEGCAQMRRRQWCVRTDAVHGGPQRPGDVHPGPFPLGDAGIGRRGPARGSARPGWPAARPRPGSPRFGPRPHRRRPTRRPGDPAAPGTPPGPRRPPPVRRSVRPTPGRPPPDRGPIFRDRRRPASRAGIAAPDHAATSMCSAPASSNQSSPSRRNAHSSPPGRRRPNSPGMSRSCASSFALERFSPARR